METKRLRQMCSKRLSTSSKHRKCVTWLGCVVIVLHTTSMLCRTWYSLYLDFDTCSSCGPLIITIGTILETANTNYIDSNNSQLRDSNQTSDDIQRVLVGMLKEKQDELLFRELLKEKQQVEITIDNENGVFVYIGLWTVMVCLADFTCAEVGHTISGLSHRNIQPLADILDSLYDSRPFLLLAIASNILMIIFSRKRSVDASTGSAKITAYLGALSALFSLLTMLIAGMPYVTSVFNFQFVLPMIPWAFFSIVLSGYFSFVIGYQLWNTHSSNKLTFRNWQAQHLYKFSV